MRGHTDGWQSRATAPPASEPPVSDTIYDLPDLGSVATRFGQVGYRSFRVEAAGVIGPGRLLSLSIAAITRLSVVYVGWPPPVEQFLAGGLEPAPVAFPEPVEDVAAVQVPLCASMACRSRIASITATVSGRSEVQQ